MINWKIEVTVFLTWAWIKSATGTYIHRIIREKKYKKKKNLNVKLHVHCFVYIFLMLLIRPKRIIFAYFLRNNYLLLGKINC